MKHEPLHPLDTSRLSAPVPIPPPLTTASPTSSRSSSSSMLTSPHFEGSPWVAGTAPNIASAVSSERRDSGDSLTHWSHPQPQVKPPNDPAPKEVYLPPNKIHLPSAFAIERERPLLTRGNTSPASSVTSTAPSRGETTPRNEFSAWPVGGGASALKHFDAKSNADAMDVDGEDMDHAGHDVPDNVGRDGFYRNKHSSLNPNAQISQDSCRPVEPRRQSEPFPSSKYDYRHRVVADSMDTGCRISAPISPPAHYPGSASRRNLYATPASESSESVGSPSSLSTNTRATSISSIPSQPPTAYAPRWARPPSVTNRISGRAWSFSQGQERPDIDFDPELFDGADPEAVEEIMKGTDGRIAVKTTSEQYVILVWLPGISQQDITVSSKGDRTVQIVADRWDENDHLEWNVLLGKDANMKAIAAKLNGSELKVTIQRKDPGSRSIRSAYTSWSAPV